jgi:predicted DsbA family dithiol-disulfide isomerase
MFGARAGIDTAVSPRAFSITFDYRCPFARVAHEHVLDGLAAGASWDVRFSPFSLSQAKDPTWTRASDSGLLALELAIAVRDGQPDRFLAAHRALFEHRHDHGGDLRDLDALTDVLRRAGVDVDEAVAALDGGVPLKTVREEHEAAEADHSVWGVPTFVAGGQAAFVRLMERPGVAEVSGAAAVDRIIDMLTGWPELNEFKHTALPR